MNDWLVWQLADSAFPAGAFAHSGGLEAAWQQGRVQRGPTLGEFVQAAVRQSALASGPFVREAWLWPDRFGELAALCDASLANHVANRASRLQGQALLAAACRIYGRPVFTLLQSNARQFNWAMHLAPMTGFVCQTLAIDEPTTVRLYLFSTLRGLVSAAIRLGIVGPMEGQQLQNALGEFAEALVPTVMSNSVADAAQSAPMLDLLQAAHDRLYSRLFQS